ncbi:indole-3-glycerol phosphate synthase TrpC [Cytophagales bacterium LB-30]|uniref:indole-3-glycerol-phosphate synthase n=1 Tax=Shiella aurantiaca TaxID=3058365 RepID=A0ABT8F7U0_9BACT|nr:indole-3-glycerol phosphate synthase TrpC [Shiella aurantiaca]MDN4166444.1 indole-3-glycerol phosphate synthase TrpC [Shiella aurantiaca]
MAYILDEIVQHKRKELEERKGLFPERLLEQSVYFTAPTVSMKRYLTRPDKSGIIAEFKRSSPSKGAINPYTSVEKTTIGYMQAGASALSVLTDKKFFGGKNEDLSTARKFNFCPILRKDFVLDPYQLLEARAIGADVVLLIAAILTPKETRELAFQACQLQMEVLLEVHSAEEIDSHLNEYIDLVGVNNRNLKTFEVNTDLSFELASRIPHGIIKVSESGISDPQLILSLREAGYEGFLMGETFMRHSEPQRAAQEFIQQVRTLESAYPKKV